MKMKFKEDIGIAVIFRNREIDKKIRDIFIKSYQKNIKFFPKKPSKFLIFMCDTEEEYKRYSRPYYTKWSTAVGLGERGITIRSLEFVGKIGRWKIKDFQNIMNHEISHIFWFRLCRTWSPQWFVEGLACYIGNNFPLKDNELREIITKNKIISSQILDYRYLRRNFEKGHFPRYPIWQSFFAYLIKHHKNSIKRFISSFSENPTKKNYQKCFKRAFGLSDKEIFNDYLSSFKKVNQ